MIKDADLVRRAREGDLAAEEELLRRYKGLARDKARMYYMVGADEDDVLQEGMIGLLKAVRGFDPEGEASFHTYAGICVTNQIISAIRAAGRKKHQILSDSLSLEDPVRGGDGSSSGADLRIGDTLASSREASPEQVLVIRDIAECILHNDDQIFSEYEMTVLMEQLRGRSPEEIAAGLDRTEKSVRNCLQRTKRKIIDYLQS